VNWQPADAVAAIGIELCKHALLSGRPRPRVAASAANAGLDLSPRLERVKSLLNAIGTRWKSSRGRRSWPKPRMQASSYSAAGRARDQVAIVMGNPDPGEAPSRSHALRLLTGDLFGSLRCDAAISCAAP